MSTTFDLAAMRRIFDGGQGERPSHNSVLQLCDEVERLRSDAAAAALALRLDGGGLTTHARMALMAELHEFFSSATATPGGGE